VTAHPTAEWIGHQLTEAFGWSEPPRYIIRDRDGAHGSAFIRRLTAMGIRDPPNLGSIALAKRGCGEVDRIRSGGTALIKSSFSASDILVIC
jgi:hypothetical protein